MKKLYQILLATTLIIVPGTVQSSDQGKKASEALIDIVATDSTTARNNFVYNPKTVQEYYGTLPEEISLTPFLEALSNRPGTLEALVKAWKDPGSTKGKYDIVFAIRYGGKIYLVRTDVGVNVNLGNSKKQKGVEAYADPEALKKILRERIDEFMQEHTREKFRMAAGGNPGKYSWSDQASVAGKYEPNDNPRLWFELVVPKQ